MSMVVFGKKRIRRSYGRGLPSGPAAAKKSQNELKSQDRFDTGEIVAARDCADGMGGG